MAHVRRVLGNELLKIVIEMEVSWRNGGKRGNGVNDGKRVIEVRWVMEVSRVMEVMMVS